MASSLDLREPPSRHVAGLGQEEDFLQAVRFSFKTPLCHTPKINVQDRFIWGSYLKLFDDRPRNTVLIFCMGYIRCLYRTRGTLPLTIIVFIDANQIFHRE